MADRPDPLPATPLPTTQPVSGQPASGRPHAGTSRAGRPQLSAREPLGSGQRLKAGLDALLVADVFLVIGGALWFGLAVVLHSRRIEAPLALFQRLWQPLFTPAIGLLMAAALVSGILGWWQRRGPRPARDTES